MKVLVTGDRNWTSYRRIREVLEKLDPRPEILVQGGARGADTIAAMIGYRLGMEVREYKADWEKYGPSAGQRRNIEMLVKEMPDLVLAFHENIEKSKGTRHMIRIARDERIPVRLFTKTKETRYD